MSSSFTQPVQESLQAASSVVYNSTSTVVDTLGKAKDTIVNTIYPSDSSSIPQPPHGVPPSESSHTGTVAYEDKTLTGKISDNLQSVQSSFTSMRRPSLEALFENLQTSTPGDIPAPPHGNPPSESCHSGIVADEDKTLMRRISESIKQYTPEVPAISMPISIPATLPLPSWSEYKPEIDAFYEQFPTVMNDTVNQAQRKLGLSYYVQPGTVPQPPHGVAPSDTNPSGRIAEIDKPIVVQLEQNWEMLRSEFMSLWGQSKRKLGWTWTTQAGKIPQAPRGVAPSESSSSGTVDPHDKTISAQVDEFRDSAQQTVDSTVQILKEQTQTMISQGGRAMGMPYQTQPGVTPEGPHGLPPSEFNHQGVVAPQDKSIPQIASETWGQVKDTTTAKMEDAKQSLNNFAVETTTALTGGQF